MGWLNPARAIHRRKAAVRTNIQDGRTDAQTSADHGGQCRRFLGKAWEDQAKRLACQHPPQKATDARDRSASEQDGSHRLGNSKARRVLHAASLTNSRAAMKV